MDEVEEAVVNFAEECVQAVVRNFCYERYRLLNRHYKPDQPKRQGRKGCMRH